MKATVILALAFLALGPAAASAEAGPGVVTISYGLFHPHWIASNQVAVWIEDSRGAYIATVFATDFMARRKGYIKRPQCCPEWVKASGRHRRGSIRCRPDTYSRISARGGVSSDC